MPKGKEAGGTLLCDAASDSAQHTLAECPAWAEERRVLVASVGEDLSLPAVVRTMVGGEKSWTATASFCEQVLQQKEKERRRAEKEKERKTGWRRNP